MNSPPIENRHHFFSGIAFAVVAACLFSLKPILVKLAYRWPVDAVTLLTLRMLLALPFYLVIGFTAWRTQRRNALETTSSPPLAKVAAVGLLGYYLASFLDMEGLRTVPAQLERVIIYTYPVMIAVLSRLFVGARHRPRTWAALALSYSGIFLMFATDLAWMGEVIWLGTGLVFASALSFALYTLLSKPLIDQVGSRLFTSVAMSSASVAVCLHFVATHALVDLRVAPQVLLLALGIAIFCTVVPSFLFSEAVRRIGPTQTSIVGGVGPASSAVLAVLILSEAFTVWHALGTALAISGVLWLRKKTSD